MDRELLSLIGSLGKDHSFAENTQAIALKLGAKDLLILAHDPDLGIILPLPGFPQTLPQGYRWRSFLEEINPGDCRGTELLSPFTKEISRIYALGSADGSILILIGENPDLDQAKEFLNLVPLIAGALASERIRVISEGEREMERRHAEKTRILTAALEDSRKTLEAEYQKSRSILNSISDVFFAIDDRGNLIEVNLQAETLFRKRGEEILGKNAEDILKEVMGQEGFRDLQRAQGLQQSFSFETYLEREKSWYEVRVYPSHGGVTCYLENIHEKKIAHEELRAERSRLRAILQQMPEGVIISDPEGKLILRNAQMDQMLGGYLPSVNINEYGQYKGFTPHGTPYQPKDWPLARSLLHGEIIQNEEVEIERLDGGRSILSISSAPIRDEENKIVAGVVIHHDVTSQKRTEAELRYQSDLNKTITDNAASALFMMDKVGKPTFMNPAAMELTGYKSIDEIADKPLHYAVHWKKPDGSHYPMEECPIDNAQAELVTVKNQEEIFCTKEGRLFPVSYSVSPLEKDGEVVGSVLEFREITEQKNIEAQLQKAIIQREKSLETLLTINTFGQQLTAELDQEKLVQRVTDVATQLTGASFGAFFYNSVDDEGKSFLLNVVSGVNKDEFKKFPNPRATEVFYPTFMGAGPVRSGDITKDPRYGKNAPYAGTPMGHLPVRSYLAVSVVSRSGEVFGGLFFGHPEEDVFTEEAEKIAEGLAAQTAIAMDNARMYGQVQESVRARDEFLSIASHELKTPLTSLKLQSQIRHRRLLKGEFSFFDEENLKKMFLMDERQIQRLTHLIEDMLDISRINTGKFDLQTEKFDLCILIGEVLESYSGQIAEKEVKVNLSCEQELIGNWDRFKLEQVIINLLTNALRYGKKKPVEIRAFVCDDLACVIVEDQGLGIAPENQKRIFERFERAISANEISGLGLGLYIVRRIVEMHGGTVEVDSELGRGSRFTVRLPLICEAK
jgi:PAS domain S-box-containing protein